MGSGEGSTMMNFIVCAVHLTESRILKWAGHVARMEEDRSAFKILTVAPAGMRPSGRPKRR